MARAARSSKVSTGSRAGVREQLGGELNSPVARAAWGSKVSTGARAGVRVAAGQARAHSAPQPVRDGGAIPPNPPLPPFTNDEEEYSALVGNICTRPPTGSRLQRTGVRSTDALTVHPARWGPWTLSRSSRPSLCRRAPTQTRKIRRVTNNEGIRIKDDLPNNKCQSCDKAQASWR
eukprot:1187192-Prorocentrum_minimum.AAC.1